MNKLPLLIPVLLIATTLGGCTLFRGEPRKEADVLREVVQLTREARFDDATEGVISPDMKWLAFRATPAGEQAPQLFIAPLRYENEIIAGLGNPVRISPEGSRNATPAFSPDGRSLVFVSTAGAADDPLRRSTPITLGYEAVAEMFRVDDWQRNVAAGDVRMGVDLARNPLTRNAGFDGEPAWSPDGRYIAFASDRNAPRSAMDRSSLVEIFVMNADGTNAVRITDAQGYDGAPAWGSNGRTLVFHSDRQTTGRFDIYAVDLAVDEAGNVNGPIGMARRLTQTPSTGTGGARQPVVHPAGDVVVYTRTTSRRGEGVSGAISELRQMRLDGTRDFPLTFNAAADESPRFSADGEHLVFSSRRSADGSRQLFVARYVRPRRS